MAKKKPKLSAKSMTLVEAFSEAAQRHGWQADQGTGAEPAKAEKAYEQTRTELEKHILSLQNRIRKLETQLLPVRQLERDLNNLPG